MKWKTLFISSLIIIFLSNYVSALCNVVEPGVTICYFDNYGANNGVYNTTRPFINLYFHEIPVTITEFSLFSINDSIYKDIDRLTPQTGINFSFRPAYHMPNRKYQFYFKATDEDNNIIITYLNFTIKVNQTDVWVTKPTNLYVQKPKFAFGQQQNFTLELELQRRGNCGFRTTYFTNPNLSQIYGDPTANPPVGGSLLAYFTQIPNSNRIVIQNFNFPEYWPDAGLNGEAPDGSFLIMYLVCREDGGERFAYEEIIIGADLTSPIISSEAVPSPVIDGNDRNTTLTITLDDHSVCTLRTINTPPDGSDPIVSHPPSYPFNSFNQFLISIPEHIIFPIQPSTYDYRFNVTCDNLANRRSSTIVTIPVNLQTFQNVEFLTPPSLFNKLSYDINVTTQLSDPSGCKYFVESSTGNTSLQSMTYVGPSTGGRILYTAKNAPFKEGNNKIRVNCPPMTTYGVRDVIVDTIAPPIPTIETLDNTCSLSRIKFTIKNGTDNTGGSGFDYYAYNVTLSNDPSNEYGFSGTTTNGVVDKSILGSLIENRSYTISAWSVDNAGNQGLRATKTVKVTNDKLSACDLDPPTIKVTEKRDNSTKFWTLTVNCTDTQSGCKSNFNYGVFQNTSQTCSYPSSKTLGESVILEDSARFCAIVFDNNNNNDTFNKLFTVIFPPTCTNGQKDGDETGIDCGGSCPKCELNASCTKDSDCDSGYCKSGICSVASCSDGIKNGDETGIDCGGLSCPSCGINASCQYDSDCASRNCDYEGNNKVCLPASCTNSKIDGSETDLNCGGTLCDSCEIGETCKINSDCVSNYCDSATRKCDIDPSLDTDGDGLPDWWEIKYCGCATCCNPDDDLDGDGYTNLEEYKNGTNPLDPLDKPDFFKLNPLALILLILGFFAIVGGSVLLYLESRKRKIAEEEAEQKRFQKAMSLGPKPVVMGSSVEQPAQRPLTSEQIALRERLKKQSQNQKSLSRKSVLDEFDDSNSSPEKPTPVIQRKAQSPQKPVNASPTKPVESKPVLEKKPVKEDVEDDVFAKLKKLTENNKKSK